MKRNLAIEAVVATMLIISITYLINFFPFKFEFTNPIKQEFNDFDIYDLCYSGNGGVPLLNDTNIIIIQTAASRAGIATQLKKIKEMNPSVLGVDLLFSSNSANNSLANIDLAEQLDTESVVPAYRLTADDVKDSLTGGSLLSNDVLHRRGGYVNFIGENFTVVRSFEPYFIGRNGSMESFSAKVVEKFAPRRALTLKERGNQVEFINYSGNRNKFLTYSESEFDDMFNTEFRKNHVNHIRNKIVLLGYFTKGKLILDDLKFSPLNPFSNGRSYPDMYGVIIQANVIDMMLENTYITMLPLAFSYLIAALVCFFLLYFIIWSHNKYKHPYHLLIVGFQVGVILVLLLLFLQLFDWFSIKIYLLPIIISLVLAVEMFEIYKFSAVWLKRRFGYRTIFT